MNLKFRISISFILALLVNSSIIYGQENKNQKITFIQGDSSFITSKNSDSIFLERKPFSIRFFCKQYDSKNNLFYSTQIAVLENPNDTSILKIGQKTSNISYFEPGSGMAPNASGMYDDMFISNSGHHYIMYENENDKRAFLISKSKDLLELEWKISTAFYKNEVIQFSDLKVSNLYFIIFNDTNLNNIIDEGELKKMKLIFK